MAFSVFDDRSHVPEPGELTSALGPAAELWIDLTSAIRSDFDPLSEDWTWSGKKWGWALRLKHKKRAIVYLTPRAGFFVAGFALGEKAVEAARASDLPQPVLDLIDEAGRYAEGRAVRLEVRSKQDLESVLYIASLKMAD